MADEMSPPEGFVEKARFDGLVRKVEQLTLENRSLNDQLAAKSSEGEQLRAQLVGKDTEKQAAASELAELRALKRKLEAVKKLGRPELMGLAEKLPDLGDAQAMESVLRELAAATDAAAGRRERELLAGVTPIPQPHPLREGERIGSEKEWMAYIEKQPLGSVERQRAWDQYWGWLESKNR